MHVCPKCHYARVPADTAPDWQCPRCGIAYAKFGTEAHGHPSNTDLPHSNLQAHEPGTTANDRSTGFLKLMAVVPVLAAIIFLLLESGLSPIHEAATVTDTTIVEVGAKARYSVLLVDVSSVHWSSYVVDENPYLINFQHRLEPGDVLEVDATPVTRRWKAFTVRRTGEVFRMPLLPGGMGLGFGAGTLLAGICLVFMLYPGSRGGLATKEDFRIWIPLEVLGVGLGLAGFLALPLNLGVSGWAAFILIAIGLALITRRAI